MDVTFEQVSRIIEKLPIGYYMCRTVEYSLSKISKNSFFSFTNDNIVISYPTIAEAVKPLTNDKDLEMIVRSIFYHEISHVILTPKEIFGDNKKYIDAINIVEDERIERLCKNSYMQVNFLKSIIILNDYKGEDPSNAEQAFYFLVRFHRGPKSWLNRLNTLIKNHAHILAINYSISVITQSKLNKYRQDIIDFYEDFINEYKSNPHEMKTKNYDNTKDTSDESNDTNPRDNEEKELNENIEKSQDELLEALQEAIEDECEELNELSNLFDIKEASSFSINKYYDANLESRIYSIIEEKLKSQKNTSSAIQSYSGRLNPRLVATSNDYKWWMQQNRSGHIKQFSKVHFNLFIDNSGSFRENDEKMNTFIRALERINDDNFSFDIITINMKVYEWENSRKTFKSNGGNRIPKNFSEIYRRHQLSNANNYNIMLFDGDMHSDDFYISLKVRGFALPSNSPITNVDFSNNIIISDNSNAKYLKYMKQAKIKYVDNYCEEFINETLNLLQQAL